eukprot:scaffold267169_cov35-Prasinocladus_malaysianus.AAC.1
MQANHSYFSEKVAQENTTKSASQCNCGSKNEPHKKGGQSEGQVPRQRSPTATGERKTASRASHSPRRSCERAGHSRATERRVLQPARLRVVRLGEDRRQSWSDETDRAGLTS